LTKRGGLGTGGIASVSLATLVHAIAMANNMIISRFKTFQSFD